MLKKIDYVRPFLVLADDDDGVLVIRYINAHQIIDIEVQDFTISILVRDDNVYTYKCENNADLSNLVHACFACLKDH